jgi:hypothetical protein
MMHREGLEKNFPGFKASEVTGKEDGKYHDAVAKLMEKFGGDSLKVSSFD